MLFSPLRSPLAPPLVAVSGVYGRGGGASVTPALTVSRVDGVGPLGVVFDATATTASSGDPFHDLLYFFDFGDETSEGYSYGTLAGTTKNRFVGGPVSCHVYETPGSYTATLWVYDGSKIWGPVTQAVTVSDPDVVYAGTLTTVVSTDGDFTGAPSGAVQVTSSDFDAQGSVMTSNRRVLFKRGQTFDASVSTARSVATVNLTVGAFGPGVGYAVVRAVANGVECLRGLANGGNPANNPNNWRVFGLHFTRADGVTGGSGFENNALYSGQPEDFTKGYTTVHKCKVSRLNRGFVLNGRANVLSTSVVENVNDGSPAGGGICVYTSDTYHLGLLDCDLAANSGGEHCIRIQGGKSIAVDSVTIASPATTKHFLTVRGDTSYTTEYVVMRGVYVDGAGYAESTVPWPVQVAPTNSAANEDIAYVLCDGFFNSVNETATVGFLLHCRDSQVRNCIVYSSLDNVDIFAACSDAGGAPASARLRFINNTYITNASGDVVLVGGVSLEAVTIQGNIASTPDATEFVAWDGSTTSATLENNSTDLQARTVDPLFNGALTSMDGFKLQTGSPYKNAGGNFKNWVDGLGYLRKEGGQFDAGALNSLDKQTDAWTLID